MTGTAPRPPAATFTVIVAFLIGMATIGAANARAVGSLETADGPTPGRLRVRPALVGEVGPGLLSAYRPQVAVRIGLTPRVDLGLRTGMRVERNLTGVRWLGVDGDVRYRLRRAPTVALGYTPPTVPLGGTSLGKIALQLSRSFGTITPFGGYRVAFHLTQGLSLSHRATVGLEMANPGRLPAVVAIGWREGRIVVGLAFRFGVGL